MRRTIYALTTAAALAAAPALAGDDCRNRPLSCDLQSAMRDAVYTGQWYGNEKDPACISARAQELIVMVTNNVSQEIRGIESRIENSGWEMLRRLSNSTDPMSTRILNVSRGK